MDVLRAEAEEQRGQAAEAKQALADVRVELHDTAQVAVAASAIVHSCSWRQPHQALLC